MNRTGEKVVRLELEVSKSPRYVTQNEKKSLMKRILQREEVNLAEYSFKEIEEVIRELAEARIEKLRTEEAIRLLDAVGVAVEKIRYLLSKEEKK